MTRLIDILLFALLLAATGCVELQKCSADAECPEGEFCSLNGYCAASCASASDCDQGQECDAYDGRCKPKKTGPLSPVGGPGWGCLSTCTVNADCCGAGCSNENRWSCRSGHCWLIGCLSNSDCSDKGDVCLQGMNMIGVPAGSCRPPCQLNAECYEGTRCKSASSCWGNEKCAGDTGFCYCSKHADCGSGQRCVKIR